MADVCPLNSAEWLYSDDDTIGNNQDTDDDGDGFSDEARTAGGSDPSNSDSVLHPDGDLNIDGLVNTADVPIAQQLLPGMRTPKATEPLHRDVAAQVNGG